MTDANFLKTKWSQRLPAGSVVGAYLRDSGQEHQEASCDQQLMWVRRVCQECGWVLPDEYVFVDAARKGSSDVGRSALKAMVEWAEQTPRPAAGILFWDDARLSRDVGDAAYYRAVFRKRGFTLVFVADDMPDLGELNPLYEAFRDLHNAKHLRDLSINVRRGHDWLIEQGYMPGGKAPRGYQREVVNLGDHRDGEPRLVSRWVPDPRYADRVRRAWQMRAQGYSLKAIHDQTRLYALLMNYPRMFRNEIYRGVLVYGERRIENFVEPLCTEAEWAAVAAGRKTRAHPRRVGSVYLLSGLIYCALCGARMNGKHITPSAAANRREHDYRYYICHRKVESVSACAATMIRKDEIEAAVVEKVVEIFLTPARLREFVAGWERKRARGERGRRLELAEKVERLKVCESAIANLLAAIESGRSVGERLAAREAERDVLRVEIDAAQGVISHMQSPEPRNLRARALVVRDEFAAGNVEGARVALRGLVERVEARASTGSAGRVHVVFRRPGE